MDKTSKLVSVSIIDPTPIGKIRLALSSKGLTAVIIGGSKEDLKEEIPTIYEISPVIVHEDIHLATAQIREYLGGKRREFNLPIDWSGVTEFQRAALGAVCGIPYGETRSYGQIAAQIGKAQAPRAIGRANATNPIPLVIPCHRVIGADGNLRGYGAGEGIKTKAWLLKMEERLSR